MSTAVLDSMISWAALARASSFFASSLSLCSAASRSAIIYVIASCLNREPDHRAAQVYHTTCNDTIIVSYPLGCTMTHFFLFLMCPGGQRSSRKCHIQLIQRGPKDEVKTRSTTIVVALTYKNSATMQEVSN